MSNGETVLSFKGVHTYYGASHILRGLTFRLGRGECVSLMGRNGMGKSTTLRTAMGLVTPVDGAVQHFGVPANGRAPYRSSTEGFAYVPEGRGIFPNLTVRENLVVAARSGRGGRKDWDLARILKLFPRLDERIDNWGNNLSGGEQQMLTIARALMTNPDVLLLDEATEGLAPLIREDIWRVLREIKAAGIACLVVDKNVTRLAEICDRHLLLVKGEIVFDGSSEDLMADADFLHKNLGV